MPMTPILPVQLFPNIFEHLPYTAAAHLSLVSQAFRQWIIDGRNFLTELDCSYNYVSPDHIQTLTSLRCLNISYYRFENIRFLSTLIHLQELDLSCTDLEDKCLSDLARVKSLTKLDLSNNSITAIGPLSEMTRLQDLNLHCNSLKDVSSLKSLTRLTDLDLSINKIDNIQALAELTQLQWLNLECCHLTKIKPLENLTDLKALFLHGNLYEDTLRKLHNLKTLTVHVERFEILDLVNLTQLEFLDIGGSYLQDQGAQYLTQLNQLTYLGACNIGISNDWFDCLVTMTHLKAIVLSNNGFNEVAFSRLSQLQNLTSLTLEHFFWPKYLPLLPALTGLTHLNLHSNSIGLKDQYLGAITELPNLLDLDISDSQLNWKQWLSVMSMSSLKKLNIQNNYLDVGEHDLLIYRYLSSGTTYNLTDLKIQNCSLNSKHLSFMMTLTKLVNLNIRHNRFTITDVTTIATLPRLQRLDVKSNPILQQPAKRLRLQQ